MSRARGNALQNALAAYLTRWWPHAESAGAGRNGTDVLGTPGVVWECKTAVNFKRDFKPGAWVKQSIEHLARRQNGHAPQVPVVVYFPQGIGACRVDHALAIMPVHVLMDMMEQAGYTPGDYERDAANANAAEETFSRLMLDGQRAYDARRTNEIGAGT